MCADIEFKATTRKQHKDNFTSLRMVLYQKLQNGDVSQFELGKLAL